MDRGRVAYDGCMGVSDATFRHAGVNANVTYVGGGAWRVDGASLDNGEVVEALRAKLGLAAPHAADTRVEIHTAAHRGVVANNTHPATRWWVHVEPGEDSVEDELDTALWICLESLRLQPSTPRAARPRFADRQFSAKAFRAAKDPSALGASLAHAMEAWLGPDADLADAAPLIADLQALGHARAYYDDDGGASVTFGLGDATLVLMIYIGFVAYDLPSVLVTVNR